MSNNDKPVTTLDLPPEFNAVVRKVLAYRPSASEDKKRSLQERRSRIEQAPTTPTTPS